MPAELYPYIYVNTDGSARELHEGERRYLETEFQGGDGAMPYVKDTYDERDGAGKISGYLSRAELPAGVTIHPAPADDPSRPLGREEYIALMRSEGAEVIENSDGSFSIKPPVVR